MRAGNERVLARPGARQGSTTEADAFLQSRLVQMYRLMFFLSGGICLASLLVLWSLYSWERVVYDLGNGDRQLNIVLTLLFGVVWVVGIRWRLGRTLLLALDAIGLLVTSLGFAIMTALGDTGHGGAMHVVAALLVLLAARAVLIPSSGLRTLVLSLAATGVCILGFAVVAVLRPVSLHNFEHQSLRDVLITMALWIGLMVATASVASRIIFGLQREIRVARRIGQYELLEKVGEGGMGVVYRARHALLRRDTALKLLPQANLSPERMARFEREVMQTARLTHPNTVAVFDYGRTPQGVFYYAMEYLAGIDLERLVSFEGALPVARTVYILRQILSSLIEAHEMGLVHRDIKPANVILTERGGEADVVKVVDFGLVKDLRGSEEAGLTAAGSITGTPLYLAPEVITVPDAAGPVSDLYAVAALGYFLVTGTHVFSGATLIELCAHHLKTEPEPPSLRLGKPLPEDLEGLILTGLAKKPEDRLPTARAFRDALDQCREVPRWSPAEAGAWWASNRASLSDLRRPSPVSEKGQTIAVDLLQRSAG